MLEVRTISIAIACPFDEAYDFAHRPENFPQWAAGLSTSLKHAGDRWLADTPEGEAEVQFSPANAFGVLDHYVVLPGKPEIYIPLRMIANDEGTELVFTLFCQPDMNDAAWDRDEAMVRADMERLKQRLER